MKFELFESESKYTAIGLANSPKEIYIRHPKRIAHASARICIASSMAGTFILAHCCADVRNWEAHDVASAPEFIF